MIKWRSEWGAKSKNIRVVVHEAEEHEAIEGCLSVEVERPESNPNDHLLEIAV